MSDDTPTQRFDAAGDSPTERLATPVATVPVEERKSRRLIIILASIGGALLLAVLIVLIVLLTRGDGAPVALPTSSATPGATPSLTPSASASPAPSPTATTPPPPPPAPTTDPEPPSTALEITEFGAAPSGTCVSGQAPLNVKWSSDNGAAAYIGVNTNDAQTAGQGWDLPPSGDQGDFPDPLYFQCGNGSQSYTITIVGTDGTKQSKKVTVDDPGE